MALELRSSVPLWLEAVIRARPSRCELAHDSSGIVEFNSARTGSKARRGKVGRAARPGNTSRDSRSREGFGNSHHKLVRAIGKRPARCRSANLAQIRRAHV